MKTTIMFCLSIFMIGCFSMKPKSIVGVWKTEIIQSEWGPNIITLNIKVDGKINQSNYFPEEGKSLKIDGSYEVIGDSLICTLTEPDDLQKSFVRTMEIIELSDNQLVLGLDNERYKFKK